MNHINSLEKATSYWLERQMSHNEEPFLLYEFQSREKAREALVELSFILAPDNGLDKLSSGSYSTADGKYEVLLCGSHLSHLLWKQARSSFILNGGIPKCEQEPGAITADYLDRLNQLTALQLGL